MSSVLGASLLAAAAILPLHLMPLLVVAVSTESRLPAVQAGWMGSAYMLGQLAIVLLLPALRFLSLSRGYAAMAAILLLGSLAISTKSDQLWLLLPWFFIGGACGAFQFLATTTAAAAVDRQSAFALRLATSLLVGGVVILGVQVADGFRSYAALIVQLSVVFVVLTSLGLVLYREPRRQSSASEGVVKRSGRLGGLFVVFLLFAGQLGFWAFAVQTVQRRGVALEHLAYAIAVCKLTAGVVLFVNSRRAMQNANQMGMLWPGLAVAFGVLGMATARDSVVFLLGLLLWELGLNVLSARTQAAVVQDNPGTAGPWLASATFLGAATGLILNGLAIDKGIFVVFVAYACFSAIAPLLWVIFNRRFALR